MLRHARLLLLLIAAACLPPRAVLARPQYFCRMMEQVVSACCCGSRERPAQESAFVPAPVECCERIAPLGGATPHAGFRPDSSVPPALLAVLLAPPSGSPPPAPVERAFVRPARGPPPPRAPLFITHCALLL